jgi:ParB/RepB/Spo0J family partition protein
MNAPAPFLVYLTHAEIRLSQTAVQQKRRARFSHEENLALADTMRPPLGILHPLVVRALPQPDGAYTHELISGERRFISSQLAGLQEVPCIVRELADADVLTAQLIENLQRKTLHPLEEAEGFRELRDAGIDPVEIGERVGYKRRYVYGRMALLNLSEDATAAFWQGKLDTVRALTVARVRDPKRQAEVLEKATLKDHTGHFMLSSRELDEFLAKKRMTIPLFGAPFTQHDTELVSAKMEPLPSCEACPKRSGNCGDDDNPDVCTDVLCFDAKVRAVAQRRRVEAEKSGEGVISGDEAKEIIPRRDQVVGHFDLDTTCDWDTFSEPSVRDVSANEEAHEAWLARLEAHKARTYRQILAEPLASGALKTVKVEDPKTRLVRDLVTVKAAKPYLKAAGIRLPGDAGKAPEQRAQAAKVDYAEQQRQQAEAQREREERRNRELTARKAILAAASEKAAGQLTQDEFVDIADFLIGVQQYHVREIFGRLPDTGKLKGGELARLIRTLLVVRCAVDTNTPPNELHEFAKRHKVDPAKIRRELENPGAAKAAKPAGKKKAKR